MTFKKCLFICSANKEMVAEFDRLTGHNLSRHGSQLELLIDDSSGRTNKGIEDFILFVKECVFDRLT